MAPFPRHERSKIIIYHQTHHVQDGNQVSLLPLLFQPKIHVTHVILAAVHLHDLCTPNVIFLNEHVPQHARYDSMWAEVRALQDAGIKVMTMVGGAAKGSFARLDTAEQSFDSYYQHLHSFVRRYNLDGVDLDIEEPMSLAGVVRLIDRLKEDFGDAFIVTLAPVAAALWSGQFIKTYAEFSYEALEVMRGGKIAWYNTQFYCGWGDMSNSLHYEAIVARGFPEHKIVVGLITNPANGPGYVPLDQVQNVLSSLQRKHPGFAGVMGWEYFNALPRGATKPWDWVNRMGNVLHVDTKSMVSVLVPALSITNKPNSYNEGKEHSVLDATMPEAPLPSSFNYVEDG